MKDGTGILDAMTAFAAVADACLLGPDLDTTLQDRSYIL
jgi:hypothetical protein